MTTREWLFLAVFILTWLPAGAITVRLLRFFDPVAQSSPEETKRETIFFWLGWIGLLVYIMEVIFLMLLEVINTLILSIKLLVKSYWYFVLKLKGKSK